MTKVENIWITSDGEEKIVCEMTTEHIKSCIKCLNGEGNKYIRDGYLGGKEKWLNIFKEELSIRLADYREKQINSILND